MSSSASELPPSDLMEVLLKDPTKRALILQLLNQEKSQIRKPKRHELKTRTTPLDKLAKLRCESPTVLQRRRALLLQRNQDSGSEGSSSELSEPSTQVEGPKLPFGELLKGVRAYVEVRRNHEDRSEGIKVVMRLMGATIKDTFTNDVTHVIFKDGSFTTYEKAKLMKVHLVSVLWLDAIRRHNARVPEKNYPAFGNRVCDANVSVLCSQIQKDYEDVIKDERRTRRHAVMTPKTSSMSSYMTADNLEQPPRSPELTSDDSDCGVVDGYTSRRPKQAPVPSSPAITDDLSTTSKQEESSGDSASLLRSRRKTVNVISTAILNEENFIDTTPLKESKAGKPLEESTSQTLSSIDTDRTRSGLGISKQSSADDEKENLNTTMSSLRLSERRSRSSSNKRTRSTTSTMSSLRLSESSERAKSRSTAKSSKKQSSTTVSSTGKEISEINRRKTPISSESVSGSTAENSTNSESSRRSRRKTRLGLVEPSEDEETSPKPKEASPKKKVRRSLEFSDKSSEDKSRSRRASLVALTARGTNDTRQSFSDDGITKDLRSDDEEVKSEIRTSSFSVVLTRIEINEEKTRRKTRKSPDDVSSPLRKTQLEESSGSKRTRRLYNPSDCTTVISSIEDEKEREECIKQKTRKKTDCVFLNPNNLLITPLPSRRRRESVKSERSFNRDETEIPSTKSTEKKKKKKKKKKEEEDRRNSVIDEQKELLELLEKREKTQHLLNCSIQTLSESSLPITPMKRRSTLDFVSLSQSHQKRRLKLDPQRISSIVCTKMHRNEVLNFESIVHKLGRFHVEDQVSGKTTHLVVGEAKRTINMLRAIARGCWILKREWLLKSAEAGKWLNEEDYELTEFSPAVQVCLQCRLQRAAFGPLYTADVFQDCGHIYVGRSTTPQASQLKELISICKGRVTNVHRNAAISVGEFFNRVEVTCVTEAWVLDSIHFNKTKSLRNYLIKSQRGDSPHF